MTNVTNAPKTSASGKRYVYIAYAAAAAIIALSSFLVWQQWRDSVARAEISVANLAKVLSVEVEGSFDRIGALLVTLGQRYVSASSMGASQVERFERAITSESPSYELIKQIGIIDRHGKYIFSTLELSKTDDYADVSDRDYFIRAKSGEKGLIYSGLLKTKVLGLWSIIMARRIEDADGGFLGVMFASIPIDALGHVFSKVDLGRSGMVTLRTADFAEVVRYPSLTGEGRTSGNHLISEAAIALMRENPTSDRFNYRAVTPNDGVERFLALDKFDHAPFSMNVGVATADVEVPLIVPAALLTGLSLSVAGLLIWGATSMRRQSQVLEERVEERTRDLAASQRFINIVTNATSGMLGYWESETRCRFANRRYSDWFGKTPDEMHHLTMREVLGPDLFARSVSRIRAALAGEAQKFEITIIRPDGSVFHGLMRYVPDIVDGEMHGIVVDFTDITDIKRLQLEQTVMADELADLYNQAPCGYHSIRPDGTILRINDTELSWLGFKREDVVDRQNITALITPASLETFRQNFPGVWESGEIDGAEFDMLGHNGAVLPVLLSSSAVHDGDGKLVMWNAVVVDYSHQRQQQNTLRKLMSASPMGIRVISPADNRVLYTNEAFRKIVGQTDSSLKFLDRRSWYCEPEVFDDIQRHIQRGEIVLNRLAKLRPPGLENDAPIWVLGSYMTIDYEGHEAELAWMFDVSEMHEAKLIAEAATQAKASFLANMSHEIRTPMNAVLGFAYLLSTSDLPAEAHVLIGKIRAAGRTLMGLLNDTLDLSKIESGRFELEHVPFRLSDVHDNLANIMSANAASKSIEVIISPSPVGIDNLIGDSLRLEQVLINLTGNAIKFTDSGYVQVLVDVIEDIDNRVTLRFSVRDSGIGIPPERQQDIFSVFSQADTSITRRFGGTGLGLAICAQVVKAMGGEIGVTSTLGQGSEFWFTAKMDRAEASATPAPAPLDLTILIADDNDIAREALRLTVQKIGWQAIVVDSGRAAIERAAAMPLPEHNVILLDWKMPEIDGLAAARAIRAAAPGDAGPIVIMVTGHSRHALLAEPSIDIVDAVMEKPVTSSRLYDTVVAVLHQRRGGAGVGPQRQLARRRLAGMRALVVDDSDVNREVARGVLRQEGATVSVAENGQMALDWLLTHVNAVDIVLMDVQMPVLDGLAATRALRKIPLLAGLPIVAMTAGAFVEQQDAAFAAGMDDYISKPIDIEAAIAIIRRVTHWPETPSDAAGSVDQADTAAADAPAGLGIDSRNPPPGLSLSHAADIWRDAETYRRFLRKFAVDYVSGVTAVTAMSDSEALQLLHKMRGGAGNLGLRDIAAAARDLEQAIEANDDRADYIQRLRAALETGLASIALYAGHAEASDKPASAELDAIRATPLLRRALAAFDTDNPDEVMGLIVEMEACVPAAALKLLRLCIDNFDFRGGEEAIRTLAADNNIDLRT